MCLLGIVGHLGVSWGNKTDHQIRRHITKVHEAKRSGPARLVNYAPYIYIHCTSIAALLHPPTMKHLYQMF